MKFKHIVTSCLVLFLSATLLAGCKPIFEKKPLPPAEGKADAAPAAAPAAAAPAPAAPAAATPANATDAADGIADVQSLESLDAEAVVEESAPVADDGGDVVKPTSAMMRDIQQALTDAGFNPGPVDGKSGGKTTAAIAAFQKQNSLPAGNIDKRTLRALGVAF